MKKFLFYELQICHSGKRSVSRMTINGFYLLFVTFFLFSLLFTTNVQAQATLKQAPILAVIHYQTNNDIEYIFSKSARVLGYFEGDDVETPFILSLLSESQKKAITDKDYTLRVVDTEADINRYELLYNVNPNQADKLNDLGEVFVITPHYTLLKMPPGVRFEHQGAARGFFDVPFLDRVNLPALKTKTAGEPEPTPAPAKQAGVSQFIIPAVIVFGLLLTAGISYFLYRRSQKNTDDTGEQIINVPQE